MINKILVVAMAVVLGSVAPAYAQDQGYEGVVAGDAAALGDEVYNPAGHYSDEIFSPDWARARAEEGRANTEQFRDSIAADREAAAAARAAEAAATQQQIDARVDAAVSDSGDYATRLDALKAPPPQQPVDQPQVSPQPEPVGDTGGDTGTVRDRPLVGEPSIRDGGVMDRMLNIQ